MWNLLVRWWNRVVLGDAELGRDVDGELRKFEADIRKVMRAFPSIYHARRIYRQKSDGTTLVCTLMNFHESKAAHDDVAAYLNGSANTCHLERVKYPEDTENECWGICRDVPYWEEEELA